MRSSGVIALSLALVMALAAPSYAQRRGSPAAGGARSGGQAVPRGSIGRGPGPRTYGPTYSRPYRVPAPVYRGGFSYGYPLGWYGAGVYGGLYYGWGSPLAWGLGYRYAPYWGPGYGYPGYPYSAFGPGYVYPGYGYPGYSDPAYTLGYDAAGYRPYTDRAYLGGPAGPVSGGLRFAVDVPDAQVFVDGYYAGVVADFDSPMQQLRLSSGPHRIELVGDGYEPVMFAVNVETNRVITYRTQLRRLAP